jgi:hypothetical protein
MSNLAEILKRAMSLDVHDRATLAERLLASLEELTEEEAERLGQRNPKEGWSSTAQVARKWSRPKKFVRRRKAFSVTPLSYHEAAEEKLLREIGYLELRTKGLGKLFFRG